MGANGSEKRSLKREFYDKKKAEKSSKKWPKKRSEIDTKIGPRPTQKIEKMGGTPIPSHFQFFMRKWTCFSEKNNSKKMKVPVKLEKRCHPFLINHVVKFKIATNDSERIQRLLTKKVTFFGPPRGGPKIRKKIIISKIAFLKC